MVIREGFGRRWPQPISRYQSPGGTEKYDEKQSGWPPNWVPPKYKSRALLCYVKLLSDSLVASYCLMQWHRRIQKT
jgi:hypothetical protein